MSTKVESRVSDWIGPFGSHPSPIFFPILQQSFTTRDSEGMCESEVAYTFITPNDRSNGMRRGKVTFPCLMRYQLLFFPSSRFMSKRTESGWGSWGGFSVNGRRGDSGSPPVILLRNFARSSCFWSVDCTRVKKGRERRRGRRSFPVYETNLGGEDCTSGTVEEIRDRGRNIRSKTEKETYRHSRYISSLEYIEKRANQAWKRHEMWIR